MRLSWELRDGRMFAVWASSSGLLVDGTYKDAPAVFIHIPAPLRCRDPRAPAGTLRRAHSR